MNWTVKKGAGLALEDFTRAAVRLFLLRSDNRILVPCTTAQGVVHAEIEESLPEGVYSAEILWLKNGHIHQSRCLQRTRIDNLFCVTENESEGDSSQAPASIDCQTVAHAYGYDGLSAYEAATFNGFVGTEEEYYNSIMKYEEVVTSDSDPVFPNDGVWRFLKSSADSESYIGMYLGGIRVNLAAVPPGHLALLQSLYNTGIGTGLINDSAITTDKLRDKSVTTPKMADSAVTREKLDSQVGGLCDTLGIIALTELDSLNTSAHRLSSSPARYVVTATRGSLTLKVGELTVFSDEMGHTVTEVFLTHCLLTNGAFDGAHTDERVYQYFRSCKISGGTLNVEVGRWTPWAELVPDALIPSDKLEDKSVTTPKLADSAVTEEKLSEEFLSLLFSREDASLSFSDMPSIVGSSSYYLSEQSFTLRKGQRIFVESSAVITWGLISGAAWSDEAVVTRFATGVPYIVPSDIQNARIGHTNSTFTSAASLVISDTAVSLAERVKVLENG